MFKCLAPCSPPRGRTTVAFNLIVHLIAFAWKQRHLFYPLPSSQNAETVPDVPPSPHPNHPLFREKHKAAKFNQLADYFYHHQEICIAVNPDAYTASEQVKLKKTDYEKSKRNKNRTHTDKTYSISFPFYVFAIKEISTLQQQKRTMVPFCWIS